MSQVESLTTIFRYHAYSFRGSWKVFSDKNDGREVVDVEGSVQHASHNLQIDHGWMKKLFEADEDLFWQGFDGLSLSEQDYLLEYIPNLLDSKKAADHILATVSKQLHVQDVIENPDVLSQWGLESQTLKESLSRHVQDPDSQDIDFERLVSVLDQKMRSLSYDYVAVDFRDFDNGDHGQMLLGLLGTIIILKELHAFLTPDVASLYGSKERYSEVEQDMARSARQRVMDVFECADGFESYVRLYKTSGLEIEERFVPGLVKLFELLSKWQEQGLQFAMPDEDGGVNLIPIFDIEFANIGALEKVLASQQAENMFDQYTKARTEFLQTLEQ